MLCKISSCLSKIKYLNIAYKKRSTRGALPFINFETFLILTTAGSASLLSGNGDFTSKRLQINKPVKRKRERLGHSIACRLKPTFSLILFSFRLLCILCQINRSLVGHCLLAFGVSKAVSL